MATLGPVPRYEFDRICLLRMAPGRPYTYIGQASNMVEDPTNAGPAITGPTSVTSSSATAPLAVDLANLDAARIHLLEHSALCIRNDVVVCTYPKCSKMKNLLTHARNCNISTCRPCVQIFGMILSHARICRIRLDGRVKCPVVRCAEAQSKLRDQRLRRQRAQMQMNHRRMQVQERG